MPFFRKKNEPNDCVKVEKIVEEIVQDTDDSELIAVISAAVIAYLGSGFKISSVSESGVIVRPLRVGEPNSPWVQYSRIKNIQ